MSRKVLTVFFCFFRPEWHYGGDDNRETGRAQGLHQVLRPAQEVSGAVQARVPDCGQGRAALLPARHAQVKLGEEPESAMHSM